MARVIHPIERESYRILRERIDLSHLPPLSRAVAERVVHATADLSFGTSLVLDEAALERGRAALLGGAPSSATPRWRRPASPRCARSWRSTTRARTARARGGLTRSAAAMRLAAAEAPAGAVWVDRERTDRARRARRPPAAEPGLVVGLPVGFVGAAEAKAALAASGLPCVTNRGERGGSAVAAAAVNALLYAEASA